MNKSQSHKGKIFLPTEYDQMVKGAPHSPAVRDASQCAATVLNVKAVVVFYSVGMCELLSHGGTPTLGNKAAYPSAQQRFGNCVRIHPARAKKRNEARESTS